MAKKTKLLGMTIPTLVVAAVAILLLYSWKKPSTAVSGFSAVDPNRPPWGGV